jgi:alkylation response protein AidB-like acyl-CoA dehydrogenase
VAPSTDQTREAAEALQLVLRETQRFCRAEIDSAKIDKESRIPKSVLEGLADLGLFGLTLPEAYGGSELPLLDACKVIQAIAEHDRSVAVTLGLHLGLGTHGLVAFGSQAQKERYLPRLSRGEAVAAFAATEPDAGSDLAALKTTVTVEGRELVVSGRKIYVTNGGLASVYTLAVSSPGLGGAARGQSLLLMERSDSGFEVEREEVKLGLKGSSTTGLLLDGARVPIDRILGEPGQGARYLAPILAWGRTLMSAGCCGAAAAALEKTRAYVETRRQFNKPLVAQEVVREQLAMLGARSLAMESLVHDVARENDDVLATRSLSAKVFCSEGGWEIIDGSIQLHGGIGFIEETGLARMLRDVRVTRIFEGANDVLLSHIGGYELTRSTGLPPLPTTDEASLAELVRQTGEIRESIDAAREELTKRYRVGVFRQPRLLHRIGMACVWRDALEATTRRLCHEGSLGRQTLAAMMAWRARSEVSRCLAEPPPRELLHVSLRDFSVGEAR